MRYQAQKKAVETIVAKKAWVCYFSRIASDDSDAILKATKGE
jgi:hypothetical protein